MKKIRTAIVGYGRNGSTMHAGGVAGNPRFAMAAVCDIDPKCREQAQARFSCPVYADYKEMLAREHPDLVVVVTRSDQHAAMACDCLKAGAHVLVTKPWAVNAAQARTMIATAKRTGRTLLPWLPISWAVDTRRLRELVSAGTIGDLILIRRTITCFGRRNDWQTQQRSGGGYLLNWGPHIFFSALLVAGSAPRSVYGQLRQTINPGDTEDVVLAVLNLANGALIVAEHTVTPAAMPTWVIQGTKGTIVANGLQLRIIQHDPPQPDNPTQYAAMRGTPPVDHTETLTGDIYGNTDEVYVDIAKALCGEAPYPVTLNQALGLTKVLDAVRASNARQRVMTLRA